MPIDVRKPMSFRSDKPCDKFNDYGCGCDWCHDCGWEKLAHADRSEPSRTEDLERKLTEAEHAIDSNRPAQASDICHDPEHWRNPETGMIECETCYGKYLDARDGPAQAPANCKNPTAPCECFAKSPAQCPCKCEFCAGRREERVEAAGMVFPESTYSRYGKQELNGEIKRQYVFRCGGSGLTKTPPCGFELIVPGDESFRGHSGPDSCPSCHNSIGIVRLEWVLQASVVNAGWENRPIREAAGDGFEEWFEQRHPKPKQFGFDDLYNHNSGDWEELREEARAAWTACADRGKR